MSLSKLDHCSIRTVKLGETRDFYVDILGMHDGDRPDFPFPGNWLYVDGVAVVHLVGVDPDDPSGLQQYLGGEISAEALDGSLQKNIHGGVPLGQWYPELEDCFLVAVTEKRTRQEIDQLAELIHTDAHQLTTYA